MNVGVVVDSTCDLPTSIIDRYQVNILKTTLTLKSGPFIDQRVPEESNRFYKTISNNEITAIGNTEQTSSSFITELNEHFIYNYDNLVVIAPHHKIRNTLHVLRESILQTQPEFEKRRKQANIRNAFKIRMIESQTGYSGYGLTLYEALRLMAEKSRSADQIKQPLDKFKLTVETYVLPGHFSFNPKHLGKPPFELNVIDQTKLRFSRKIPIFTVSNQAIKPYSMINLKNAENNFLELMYDKLTRSTLSNHLVNISYAGNLSQLRVLPAFKALHEHIKSRGGKLVYSVMSPVSAAQLGLKALSIAFSVQP